MSDTGQELGPPLEAAEVEARGKAPSRPLFFVRSRGPAPVRGRKARVEGLTASFSHALEQRQLFVLLPYGIILGLVASLVADAPPEPLALGLVATGLAMALWLARRTVTLLRSLLLAAAFWTGFSLLAVHGALFGTPMLHGSVYGTYQVRVDSVVAVAPGDVIEGAIRFYSVPGPAVPNAYDSELHSYFDGIGAYGDAGKPVTLVH